MAGTALVSFTDFVTATNEHVLTGPKEILNDATLHTYVMADMLKGKGAEEVVKSGRKISDRIQLVAGSQFEYYDPNTQFSPATEQTLTNIEVPWRFAKDCWGWTDHEVELNGEGGDKTVQYKSLRDAKRQACVISTFNGMEAQMWASPDVTTMEAATTGGRPYSIRAFVTENGLSPWSGTLMTVDPTVKTNWQNQVAQFSYASIDTSLAPAFDAMWLQVKFESPTSADAYFAETKFNKFKIYTNKDGRNTYVRLTRNANDRAVNASGKADLGFATVDPTYSGIPVKYIEQLDNVGYTLGQPRFFWLNFEYLFPIFHSKRYMMETDPIQGGQSQPYSWVVFKDTWYNLFCRSRKRQGIVVPV